MSRAEKVAEAQALRGEGLLLREIAERMGAKITTVNTWLCDPDLSRQRARRVGYAGVCVRCGGVTDGSSGAAQAPDLCQACREWTPNAIIDAIRTWADAHGGIPPTATDWRHADVDHPSARTVGTRIGWNTALLQAGYALRYDRRPETQAWVMRQIRAGVPTAEIAEALGVTPRAIHGRCKVRGLKLSEVRVGRVAA